MSSPRLVNVGGEINLQATLSAASAATDQAHQPHHPITCTSPLALYEDGTMECAHARVPPNNIRTQHCIDHSVALLIIELAQKNL